MHKILRVMACAVLAVGFCANAYAGTRGGSVRFHAGQSSRGGTFLRFHATGLTYRSLTAFPGRAGMRRGQGSVFTRFGHVNTGLPNGREWIRGAGFPRLVWRRGWERRGLSLHAAFRDRFRRGYRYGYGYGPIGASPSIGSGDEGNVGIGQGLSFEGGDAGPYGTGDAAYTEPPLAGTYAEPPLGPSPYAAAGYDNGDVQSYASGYGAGPQVIVLDNRGSARAGCQCGAASSSYGPVVYRYGRRAFD